MNEVTSGHSQGGDYWKQNIGGFVGIDWGGEAHQVCVLDRERRKVGERSIRHDGEGIAELITWLSAAIEVPHGPIVEALLASGITVFAINPKQVDRFRDRYTVNGAKDDSRDAYVIAVSLSTDMQAFKKLTPEKPVHDARSGTVADAR